MDSDRSSSLPPPHWHSRGYLPHFDGGGLTQFLTFRLAGSLPAAKLAQWEEELKHLPENGRDVERRKRIEAWLDRPGADGWLRNERIARIVEDALLRFDADRYRLHAWVVMPNHVHALITIAPAQNLSAILHSWKSFTATQANRVLGRRGKFWQEEYFDRFLRDAEHFAKAVDYIEMNPVKSGLCRAKGEWRFGSAWRLEKGEHAMPGA